MRCDLESVLLIWPGNAVMHESIKWNVLEAEDAVHSQHLETLVKFIETSALVQIATLLDLDLDSSSGLGYVGGKV